LSGTGTYVASTDYTATGGIDTQALGNGVINNFTYDAVSNRLDRIYTGKPGFLALVDLSYEYDPAGNISQIDDGARQETRSYQYDFLDRLTFAGVDDTSLAGTQMIEERYYSYDQIGNLLSFRHRYPSAGQGRGAFQTGDELASENNTTRGSFNGLSSTGLTSANHTGSAVMPYVYGFGGEGADSYNGRGSLASGAQGEGSSYQGAGSFNPLSGAGTAPGQAMYRRRPGRDVVCTRRGGRLRRLGGPGVRRPIRRRDHRLHLPDERRAPARGDGPFQRRQLQLRRQRQHDPARARRRDLDTGLRCGEPAGERQRRRDNDHVCL
jgi:hypothetical protein